MKKTEFYPTIWQTIPYSYDVFGQCDAEGKQIKDLVLKSKVASEKGVSEMTLNISGLSAFDKKGKEHFITDFTRQAVLNLKGMHTGLFIKSKSVLRLKAGEYTTIRFYLDSTGNRFGYSDRSSETMNRFNHLDFEIENGLRIKGKEASHVVLRFDFEPYTLSSYFKPVQQLFKRSKSFKTALADSFLD
ncbi:MAG TPA: hypothetical protein VKN36_15480 [Eudoraea sp.]|nr:hypothetical protein [Eudoraea sp.]